MEERCGTCEYWAEYEGVCCNGLSEYRADFTEVDHTCSEWVEKSEK